ncbi:hypothetical protein Back11_57560 [Paenibacillus baekrokdamisoli]|uniref:Uncharacterized protein n=1 Tax=Paenibacillus baekrokdamisoli TaxID=1712516 RepID=A0A3G9JES4_9BACL|nr:nucleotidyltransferase domain-containing protein [Paenibacillus baekrokdamisoli]MBB3072853.1 hypothetical protein [Paenibacillus baekrokdamisoli]BBH24411.1 hypothetical protein Back11_57560 [Paenibacillus baekrokdamisoli]
MENILDIAHTLVNHIRTNYPDDIALIGYYGSQAQGTATKRSDLDFFFIPATSKGYHASIQFVLNDISFDFWPISWERAERMAAFEDSFTTIIADCKILYVRSDDDQTRFLKLRDTITEMPQHGLKLMERAEAKLRDAYVHLYKMSRSDNPENITFYRNEAHEVLTNVLDSLALLNRTYFTKGWGKNSEQIMSFPLKPSRLEELLETIMYAQLSKEIREACEQLAQDTLDLLLQQKETYSTGPSYPDRMKGFYEEIKGTLDKILTACETNDYHSAFFVSIGVQDLTARFLYYTEKGHWPNSLDPSLDYQSCYNRTGLPNLAALLDPNNLAPLQEAVERLDHLLENHLRRQGVDINRFENMTQFEAFLKSH